MSKKTFHPIVGGGEMGERIRTFNWAKTELGPINTWSQSLLTATNIVLQSPVPLVMLWGKDGIMIYNDAYSQFAGARHPFLLGSKVLEGWPEVADFNSNVMKKGLRGKTLSYKNQRLVLYRNNVREEVWCDLNYSPVIDEHGKSAGVLAIVVETTQRVLAQEKQQKAEEELQASKDRLQDLFMQAPAVITVLWGKNHVFELANPLYMELIGPERKIIGKPIREALPELKGQGFFELLDNVYKTGKTFLGNEILVKLARSRKNKDLDQVYLNFVYQPIIGSKKKVEGIFVHAVDVTDQVLNKKKIEELSRQKDDFLGIASHELKTPVTSIKAYGQVLQRMFKSEGNDKGVAHLAKMDAQVNRLSNLIGDLLDVTKIQSGRLQFHEEHFDFNHVVNEVIEEIQRTTDKHRIIKKLDKTKKLYGDPERIGQVLINLMTNAIKYSPKTDKIVVSTNVDAKSVTLCVQDFGVGIPKDKKEKVFEQFFRVSGPKQDTFPGLGLGLYISSEIIKREGGRIWVESREGKGSTFCFTLPIKRTPKKK